MPKSFYNTEAEIPADQKGAYALENGRWNLTELEKDHPVVIAKTGLETTQTSLKSQIGILTSAKELLEQQNQQLSLKVLPDGQIPTTQEIVDLGTTAKAEGLTKETIPTMKKDNDRFKADEEVRTQTDFYNSVAADEIVGLNPAAFTPIALRLKLPIEKKTEKINGKEVTDYLITHKEGNEEKKTSLKKYVEDSADFQPFKASLYEKQDSKDVTKFPKQRERESGNGGKTAAERRIERQNARLVEENK